MSAMKDEFQNTVDEIASRIRAVPHQTFLGEEISNSMDLVIKVADSLDDDQRGVLATRYVGALSKKMSELNVPREDRISILENIANICGFEQLEDKAIEYVDALASNNTPSSELKPTYQ
jgi:hypothetical protein